MKLLFDENVSPTLSEILSADYFDGTHVRSIGLMDAEDDQIWSYCRDRGFVIVSKETDFRERSFVEGFPPKVVWLDVGNAGTQAIADLPRQRRERVEAFAIEEGSSFLVLSFDANAI